MSLTTLPADYYDLSFLEKINDSDDDDDHDGGDDNNNNNNLVHKVHQSAVVSTTKNHKKSIDTDSDDDDSVDSSSNYYKLFASGINNKNSYNIYESSCNFQLLFNISENLHINHSTSDDIWNHLRVLPLHIDSKEEDCCPLQLNNLFYNDVELFYAIQLHIFEQWCQKTNNMLPDSVLSCLFYRCFCICGSQDYLVDDTTNIHETSTKININDDKYALAKVIPYYLVSIMHLNPSWICKCIDIITVLSGHIKLHKVFYDFFNISLDHHIQHHHHHHDINGTNSNTTSDTTANILSSVLHDHNLFYFDVVLKIILLVVQKNHKNISITSHPFQQQQQPTHDSTIAMTHLIDLLNFLCILICDHTIQLHFYSIISYTIQLLLDVVLKIHLNDNPQCIHHHHHHHHHHLQQQQQQQQGLCNEHIVVVTPSDGDSPIDSEKASFNTDERVDNISSLVPLQLKRSLVKLIQLSGKLRMKKGGFPLFLFSLYSRSIKYTITLL